MDEEANKFESLLTANLPPKKKRRIYPYVTDEKGYRLKAGSFPIRVHNDGNFAELMLISSKNEPSRWTVIRGNIDPGEIAAESAMRETRERSGAVGRLREPERPLGVWTNQEKRTKTSIFILDVTQELEKWGEEDRVRKWFTIEEAEEALRARPTHSKMIETLKERLQTLMQEQKEVAERKAAAMSEETRPEAEDGYVLQPNGIPLGAAHLVAPLPTLAHHHSLSLSHLPQHTLPQHHQHALQHSHALAHIPGLLPSHVGLPEIAHLTSDGMENESHGHSTHQLASHQPHSTHSAYVSTSVGMIPKRKHDDISKDSPLPPPLGGHSPNQQ